MCALRGNRLLLLLLMMMMMRMTAAVLATGNISFSVSISAQHLHLLGVEYPRREVVVGKRHSSWALALSLYSGALNM